MFEVKHKQTGTIRIVYGIRVDQYDVTYFLSYTKAAGWIWFNASDWELHHASSN